MGNRYQLVTANLPWVYCSESACEIVKFRSDFCSCGARHPDSALPADARPRQDFNAWPGIPSDMAPQRTPDAVLAYLQKRKEQEMEALQNKGQAVRVSSTAWLRLDMRDLFYTDGVKVTDGDGCFRYVDEYAIELCAWADMGDPIHAAITGWTGLLVREDFDGNRVVGLWINGEEVDTFGCEAAALGAVQRWFNPLLRDAG